MSFITDILSIKTYSDTGIPWFAANTSPLAQCTVYCISPLKSPKQKGGRVWRILGADTIRRGDHEYVLIIR